MTGGLSTPSEFDKVVVSSINVRDCMQLSSATVAKIFAAQIKTWNDPAILADNPVAAQPKLLGLNGQTKFTLKIRLVGNH